MINCVLIGINLLAILFLFCSAISDLETRLVSDKYTYIILGLSLIKIVIYAVSAMWYEVYSLVGGGLAVFIALIFSSLITNKGGGADVKVTSALALCFGLENILAIIIIAFIFAIVYLVYRKRKHKILMKQSIPYIPFLFIGTVFCYGLL